MVGRELLQNEPLKNVEKNKRELFDLQKIGICQMDMVSLRWLMLNCSLVFSGWMKFGC